MSDERDTGGRPPGERRSAERRSSDVVVPLRPGGRRSGRPRHDEPRRAAAGGGDPQPGADDPAAEVVAAVRETVRTGRPADLAADDPPELAELLAELSELGAFARSLAKGDLDAGIRQRGEMAGALKGLQADLRHLTWQTRQVADGDFSQRVDFMGQFSEAFNSMVVALETARGELSQRNDELLDANSSLEEANLHLEEANDRLEQMNGRLTQMNRRLEQMNQRLVEMATTDALTGAFNRRRFYELLDDELQRQARYGNVFSLIMLDIDHFKRVNDTYGHSVGDEVLKGVAEVVRDHLRANDRLTRWGGEEFIVLTPSTGAGDALALAERLRERVADWVFPTAGSVTVSLGVAEHRDDESGDEVINRADAALYRAKENGRDRCEAAD